MPPSRYRISTDPTTHPPQLFCPCCSMPLVYRSPAWVAGRPPAADVYHFACPSCGSFESRPAAGLEG